jgi:hypothetical protein
MALLLAVAGFAVCYIGSGYDALVKWFFAMNDCFYRNGEWTRNFFTPQVKAAGNSFAGIALAISLVGIGYIAVRWKYLRHTNDVGDRAPASPVHWLWYLPVLALAGAAWYWGQALAAPSADEIFSAVNCAELSPFQVTAYYMLPNNHIYFNFLNGYLSRWTNADTVQTGRVLSLIAYTGVLLIAFNWFAGMFKNKAVALLAVLPVALQFTAWSFGFQARGYECQLLCAWVAFVTMLGYLRTARRSLLRVNTLFCILGFAMVPTFLLYYLTQAIFMLLYQVATRKPDRHYFRHGIITMAGVYLLYVPALCFSGLAALTANDYVKSPHIPLAAFVPHLMDVFRFFVNFVFSFIIRENHPLNFILFASPLLLFLFRDAGKRMLALFYVALWLIWAAVCVFMERYPFSRNMVLNYSLSMGIIIYTFYACIVFLTSRITAQRFATPLRWLAFGVPVMVVCMHMMIWGRQNVSYFLYFMNVNDIYANYAGVIPVIPPGSTVACSPERYCFYYYCRKGPYRVSRCPGGNEDFYIMQSGETLPAELVGRYERIKGGGEGDMIYRKNK